MNPHAGHNDATTGDELFPPLQWQPLPRSEAAEQPVPIVRHDEFDDETGGEGPQVISRNDGTALVRFRHAAPSARAVALQANGWWQPDPRGSCDLQPTGNGWWEATFEVPADWRATYGYVEHAADDDPPWWESGLKTPGAAVVTDLSNPRRHRAGRGGALRAVVSVPDDGPFTVGVVKDAGPSPVLHTLETSVQDPLARWWASRPGDPGCADLDANEPLPLLVVTDGLEHVDQLGTPERLRRGVTAGLLPPLAALFVESGPRRAEVLGVPGGHAQWIAEVLLPRLRAQGLGDGTARVHLTPEAARTIVSGASFGGLTALVTVARAPHLVGAAIAQSVSLCIRRALSWTRCCVPRASTLCVCACTPAASKG